MNPYGKSIEALARKLVRMKTGDLFAATYPVEFVPREGLCKGNVVGGPWFNCVVLIEREGVLIIRGTNGQ